MDTSASRTRFVTLLGTAAAAATATFVASRLGVAGTIVGAALVAVIASIGAEVYTTAARRTSERVAALARVGRAPDGSVASGSTARTGDAPAGPPVDPFLSNGEQQQLWLDPITAESEQLAFDHAGGGKRARDLRFSWVHVAGVAGIVFVVVLVGITVLEIAAGRPLSSWWTDDDSSGTTIGSVVDPARKAPASTPPSTAPVSSVAPTTLPAATPPTPEPTTVPSPTAPPVTSPAVETPQAIGLPTAGQGPT